MRRCCSSVISGALDSHSPCNDLYNLRAGDLLQLRVRVPSSVVDAVPMPAPKSTGLVLSTPSGGVYAAGGDIEVLLLASPDFDGTRACRLLCCILCLGICTSWDQTHDVIGCIICHCCLPF